MNAKIFVMKLIASDMFFYLRIVPKVSLTQLLTPWVAVIWAKRKNLWALCIFHV
jgi:hypothetical protein